MTSYTTTLSTDALWNTPNIKPQLDCRQNICIVNYIALKVKFQQCRLKITWISYWIKLYCFIIRCFVVVVGNFFVFQKIFDTHILPTLPLLIPLFCLLSLEVTIHIISLALANYPLMSLPFLHIVSPHSYFCSLLPNIIRFDDSVILLVLLAAIIHVLCIRY